MHHVKFISSIEILYLESKLMYVCVLYMFLNILFNFTTVFLAESCIQAVGEVYLYGSVRTLRVKTLNFNYCDMSDECIVFLASAAVRPTDPEVRSGVKRR